MIRDEIVMNRNEWYDVLNNESKDFEIQIEFKSIRINFYIYLNLIDIRF